MAARVRIPLGVQQDSTILVPWCSLECTPACQAGGRGFKSRRDRGWFTHLGRVAQSAERPPEKRKVTGSTPVPTTRDMQVRTVVSGTPLGLPKAHPAKIPRADPQRSRRALADAA